ncbi:GDSL-type esterase/lipase family protein [Edaphobacter bradus]|uniref:GDSL-type esterase/lipase family protein n=1 Tax=Edaphobacter bradus TaxID=2259016 RepID=UPI0021E0189F|nr:GDSL-type esterase/lipase family protein [Edaphobacter bradus]
MSWKRRGWTTLVGMLLAVHGLLMWLTVMAGAQIVTTQVTDTIYRADGTPATGTVLVSWPAFTNAVGESVPSGSTSVTIAAGGSLSVALAPNAGSTPMGSYYTAVYHLDDGTTSREFWVVPASQAPVHLSAIKSSVLPTSVAMQTVSKSYVDTAIAAAVAGRPLDQSNPYVLKAGDTMTGPLVLPGDPTAPLQAAGKQYVDTSIAGLTAGLAQKVSTTPQSTQTVAQPAGSSLQVNNLNGVEYASQYQNGRNNNGIANATQSTDCASGCEVKAEQSYSGNEGYNPTDWKSQTHVEDARQGQRRDSYLNPESVVAPGVEAGQVIDVTSTRSGAVVHQLTGTEDPASIGLQINHHVPGGGSNQFPQSIDNGNPPYFKSGYSALMVNGTYNSQGQHVLAPMETDCFGVGDCLIGSQFLFASGGFRDNADEGTHPFDLQVREDSRVFAGNCTTGCTTGSTAVTVTPSQNPGTQGDGRYLIDTNSAKVLTAGQLTGTGASGPNASAAFSGTTFPVSTFFTIAQAIPSQANDVAPGTVTVAIATTGVPSGFATNTAAAPAGSGVACIADPTVAANGVEGFETASYTVVDGTHLQLVLNKAHATQATVAIGGLCGYGLEQTVDTANGIRQVFPVIGSYSATGLYYAGGATAVIGKSNTTSAFQNLSLPIASLGRSGNTVTVTAAGFLPLDVSGLNLTVSGVADASYNGSFVVTTTGSNTLTYAQSGPNSTSTGGTLSLLTGGYALYPMAEVLSVMNPANKRVDGSMTLAPNTVAWAANDSVEEPHYYQQKVAPDLEFIGQTIPRPLSFQRAGLQYEGNNGPGLQGWTITNATPASSYFGNGGTHGPPDMAYEASGIWKRTMVAQAGEQSVFTIHCNSHGCGKWNSGYNLFELDSSVATDVIGFQPLTSTLTMSLRGTGYTFAPQGFTAGVINATTVNATTLNGAVGAAQLPVFQASGSGHAQGVVPDPGATAGTARYLREDGTWAVPPGSGSQLAMPAMLQAMPERAHLLGEYLLNEGTGTVADDTSGNNNNGTISGATWEGSADLSFTPGQYIQLPVALNQTNTWQFAIYSPPFGNSGSASQIPTDDSTSFGQNPSLLCGNDTAHTCLIASSFFGPVSHRFMAFNTDSTEASEPLPAGWHIVTLVNGQGGQKDHWYYDGAEVNGYAAQSSGAFTHPSSGNYQIGGSSQYTGSWFTGKIAAVWAWSTSLSSTEVQTAAQNAVSYVQSKGAAPAYRPIIHDAPLVIGGIDSRTAGLGVSAPWISNLSLADPTYTTLDLGFSGTTVFDHLAMFDLMYAPRINGRSGPTIDVFWGGVNDFSTTMTARQVANSLKGMVQKAKAAGARVIVATEISSHSTGNGDTMKNALNTIVRSEALTLWGADNVADLATVPQLGADGASNNATYFSSQLHPTDAGEVFVTSVMSDAVNELIGSTETSRHATAASSYQELAGDRFLDLTGTSAQSVSLPDCIGYSLPRQIVNLGTAAGTVAAINSETLTGSSTLAIGSRAIFVPVPGALSTGGCHWERTQ